MPIQEQIMQALSRNDSPILQNFRKPSNSLIDSFNYSQCQTGQLSPSKLHEFFRVPSIKLQKRLTKQLSSERISDSKQQKLRHLQQKKKNVSFYREKSAPLEISISKAIPQILSSEQSNRCKRLTSLQMYFQETRSVQFSFETQQRIISNQNFISGINQFQGNLSRSKPSNRLNYPKSSRINISKNRLEQSQSRPKPLRIEHLEDFNVKKQKDNVLVEKIMKQKIKKYQEQIYNKRENLANEENFEFFETIQTNIPTEKQIKNLIREVQKVQQELKQIKKAKNLREQKFIEINGIFKFLY